MITFRTKFFDSIIVLGYFISVKDDYVDLREPNCVELFKNKYSIPCQQILDGMLNKIISEHLPAMPNWGDGEDDWDYACNSKNPRIRKLLALNGKQCECVKEYTSNLDNSNSLRAQNESN